MASAQVDYDEYIKSTMWRNISAKMKQLARYRCQRCGKTFHPSELEVHHRNYDRLGRENPGDLEVLCKAMCHSIADAERARLTQQRREARVVQGEVRQFENARDTYLSKKYGDNWSAFADDAMHEEFEHWHAKKRYRESGEDNF
jgi:HNH endonuclease